MRSSGEAAVCATPSPALSDSRFSWLESSTAAASRSSAADRRAGETATRLITGSRGSVREEEREGGRGKESCGPGTPDADNTPPRAPVPYSAQLRTCTATLAQDARRRQHAGGAVGEADGEVERMRDAADGGGGVRNGGETMTRSERRSKEGRRGTERRRRGKNEVSNGLETVHPAGRDRPSVLVLSSQQAREGKESAAHLIVSFSMPSSMRISMIFWRWSP